MGSVRDQLDGSAFTMGGTKGTVRRPSKRPPRKMRVFVVGVWEPLECSNAVIGGGGKPPVSGRGIRWRIPG